MTKFGVKVVIVSTLLVAGLMVNPVSANHYNYNVAPLATFVMLDLLLRDRHSHRHRYGYSKRMNRYPYHNRRYSRSYSHEGYSHGSDRIHSKRKYKH